MRGKPGRCPASLRYVHERQREGGRPCPWLFFNASTGKYYRQPYGELGKWMQTGAPHSPVTHDVQVLHGAVCLPAAGGRKDDLAVTLPEPSAARRLTCS